MDPTAIIQPSARLARASGREHLGCFLPNPKLKLREQLAEVCRFRHLSHRTENAYWHWIKGFIQFHRGNNGVNARPHPGPLPQGVGGGAPVEGTAKIPSPQPSPCLGGARKWDGGWRHPRDLGAPEVQAYLSYLAVKREVAVATQRQALNAIVFLYRDVLNLELGLIGAIEKPQRPVKVPTVLTKEEVRRVLGLAGAEYQLVCRLLYGTGMRLLECLRLRVKDVDFGRNEIVIHDGKGAKDRVTMLPERLKAELQTHLARVREIHGRDLAAGWGRVGLPHALARKFQKADQEWCWQFVFPAGAVARDPVSGLMRRHHLHEKNVQRAVKAAAEAAQVSKPVTPHTFRHSFATHLLERGTELIRSRPRTHPCGAARCARIPISVSQTEIVGRCRIYWGTRM